MTSYFYLYSPILNLGSRRVYTSFSLLFTLHKPVKPGAFWTLPPIISTSLQAIDGFAEAAHAQLTGFERTKQYDIEFLFDFCRQWGNISGRYVKRSLLAMVDTSVSAANLNGDGNPSSFSLINEEIQASVHNIFGCQSFL